MDAQKYPRLIRSRANSKFTQVALNHLAQEFFPENPDEFIRKMVKLLKRRAALKNPLQVIQSLGRTAELFAAKEDREITGVLLMKYFPWTLLAPQLHFVCQDGSIFLCPLADLVVKNFGRVPLVAAAELSYFWVDPDLRGQGLGRLLFDGFHQRCQEIISPNGLTFTVAKSTSAKTKKGSRLQHFLLQVEAERNGFRTDGTSIVTGVAVPLDWALKQTGVEEQDFLVHPWSFATKTLAQEFKFDFLCFNKNLGSLYAKVL